MMRRTSNRIRFVPKNCNFCSSKTDPDYKETGQLEKYLTERGKIIGRSRTGLCSHHQRVLTRAVKWARFIALLPFVVRA